MSPAALVLADEAVQALLDPNHPKHRDVVALLTEANRRNLRRCFSSASENVVHAGWVIAFAG